MSAKRGRPAPSLEPQMLTDSTWYYEGRSGLSVYHEVHDAKGRYVRTIDINIPWKRILFSAYRCGKVKEKP